MAYLRLIVNPLDQEALLRIINNLVGVLVKKH